MDWFKFYGRDWLLDGKVMTMIPEDRICFITLLCLASATEEQGVIKDHSEDSIISMSHLTKENADNAQGTLKRLQERGMVNVTKCNENSNDTKNVTITISAFSRRQGRALTVAERQSRYRSKKKSNGETGLNKGDVTESNENVTGSNARVTLDKSRRDKIRIDNNKIHVAKATSLPKSKNTKPDDTDPMTREQFVEWMRKSTQPHVKWLAEYADEKKPRFETKGQWRDFFSRNVKAAAQVRKYTDDQIAEAFEMVEKNRKTKENPKGYITKWGIETIIKFLDELTEK